MRLKVTFDRPHGSVDLNIMADATATVGDLAGQIAATDPASEGPCGTAVTLRISDIFVPGQTPRVLDAETCLLDADLRSGSRIELTSRQPGSDAHRPAAALLEVISGPDTGKQFFLPDGVSLLGRDPGSDIVLDDPSVSKQHARITVTDAVEIADLNSANGVVVSGDVVANAAVTGTDVVILGDSSVRVELLHPADASPGPVIEQLRSPRVVPRYPGGEFPAPVPPTVPQPQRFPFVALAAPLIIGAALFLITASVLSVVMMALTPVLLIGSAIDQRLSARRSLKMQKKRFGAAMLQLHETLEREREDERRVRRIEAPSVSDAIRAIEDRSSLLWTRRPEHAEFGWLTLGQGRARSRNVVTLPSTNDTFPEYWEQLVQLRATFATIDEVPVVAELAEAGSIGVAGPDDVVGGVTRGLLLQLLALHSPAEVVLTAVLSPASRECWEWLKWLPHSTSPCSPISGEHLVDGPTSAAMLLAALETVIDTRCESPVTPRGPLGSRPDQDSAKPPSLPLVLVLVTDDAAVDRGRLTRLVERGPDAGVHIVWCASKVGLLPAACRTFISLDSTDSGAVVGQIRTGDRVHPVDVETVTIERAERLARLLSPVVDVSIPDEDDSDLPASASYALLAGKHILDSPDSIVERWRENHSLVPRDGSPPVRRKKEGDLRALVGSAGSSSFYLDLRRDGPHALVGGTTGAGKSEFLQSWVLGMAAGHSPDRLTFLLVDYKGGSAFADCVELPHTVGLVTDLSPHLVRRALTSLKAELQHRERLLHRKKAKDLVSLERTGDPECPPSLVIIVDEFAALKQEIPEFVDGVIDVGQRGRSLGLHLVLATQRPAGVINGSLRANTNLRIVLRMADKEDSLDILDDPMAAFFDPAIPGRAAAKTGPGRIQPFQTGYVGGWTTDALPRPRIEVSELGLGSGSTWEAPAVEVEEVGDPGPTDITRVVATVRAAALAAGVPEPRKPWLPELAQVYNVDRLSRQVSRQTDERIALGVVDLPERQEQTTFFYCPDTDGNMALFGTGGSGKSAALRTLAVSAARSGLVHVYGLDFGSGGLRMLEELPHVGAIIDGEDEERVGRLLRMLRDLVDERSAKYAKAGAGTIVEYRSLAKVPHEPRYLLLVDGIGAFRDRYELSPWFTIFSQIAADGRPVGVHIVMSGDRANAMATSIASTVQRRIVLRMADEGDYALLGTPKDILSPTSPPGRGVLAGHELQLAILGDSPNVALQVRAVHQLAEGLRKIGAPQPRLIRRLPEQVLLDDLPVGRDGLVAVGVDDLTLGVAQLAPRGTFMIAGPPKSGRTTALATVAASLHRQDPTVRQVLLTPRRSVLTQWPNWCRQAEGAAAVTELATSLTAAMETGARFAIFIEHIAEFTATGAEYELDKLVRVAARNDSFVVAESETSTWNQAYTLAQPFKAGRRGLLLAPGDLDGDSLLGISLGRLRRTDFPAGRGFLIDAGRARKLQFASEGAHGELGP